MGACQHDGEQHRRAEGNPVGLENAIQQNDLLLSVAAWGGKAAM